MTLSGARRRGAEGECSPPGRQATGGFLRVRNFPQGRTPGRADSHASRGATVYVPRYGAERSRGLR